MGLPADAVIEITMKGTLLAQTFMNVFHLRVAAQAPALTSVATEMQGLAAILNDNTIGGWKQTYRLCLTDTALLDDLVVQPVFPARFRRLVTIVNSQGLASATSVPNVQASITTRDQFAGRKHVGGVRIPASPTDAVNGRWDPQYLANLQLFANQLVPAVVNVPLASSYHWCIYHRGPNDNPKFNDIENAFPQVTSRVIRRRTVGLGI